MGGKDVPYGKIWRTGANEPTVFFASVPVTVAGIEVAPGVYSLYTVPGPKEWEIIVNRSISQWGKEDQYTDAIKAQELGRAKVKSEDQRHPVETFTIRAEPAGKRCQAGAGVGEDAGRAFRSSQPRSHRRPGVARILPRVTSLRLGHRRTPSTNRSTSSSVV